MIIVRETFQVKFGHMDPVLRLMRDAQALGVERVERIMTDATGQMFTLVAEWRAESIDAFFVMLQETFAHPQFDAYMQQLAEHIEHGRRDFYTLEWERS